MDLRWYLYPKNCNFSLFVMLIVHAPSSKVCCLWDWRRCSAAGKEKQSVEELEGGVYLCALHDIFFTLRLSSCTAVNMMDNVLGRGLPGVICCLYNQLWRAETGRERREWEKLTEGSRRRGKQNRSSLQPNPAGGSPNWGDLKLKV